MTNEERAGRARIALAAYKDALGEGGEADVVTDTVDLLTDLFHLLSWTPKKDRGGKAARVVMGESLRMAEINFDAER